MTLGVCLAEDKPAFIKISKGASVTGLTATDNTVIGNADFINNEGSLEDATLNGDRIFAPNAEVEMPVKQWHEKPVWFIAATIFCGLVVAFCAYYFGWTK